MSFGRDLDTFIRWFFYCGLSDYPSFNAFRVSKTRRQRIVQYIPIAGLIALAISTCNFVYIKRSREERTFTFMNILFILAPTLTTIVCAVSTVFSTPYFAKIWSQIDTFECLLKGKFVLDVRAFRSQFLRRAYIVSVSFVLTQLIGNFLGSDSTNRKTKIFASITSRILVVFPLIQALFYIDLLDYLLQCFVRYVSSRPVSIELSATEPTNGIHSRRVQELKAKVSEYKTLHFQLWKLSRNINRLFAWTNIAILLHNFFFTFAHMRNGYGQMRTDFYVCITSKTTCSHVPFDR